MSTSGTERKILIAAKRVPKAQKARAGTPLEAFVEKGLVREECKELYANVVACMEKAEGNISPCQKQWALFAKCHSKGQS